MFGKYFVKELIDRSAENEADRRRFLRGASMAGLGVVGAGLLGSAAVPALAETTAKAAPAAGDGEDWGISDAAILNFALNLEYLEGEFYSYAVYGHGLPSTLIHGQGRLGPVIGGAKVPFKTRAIRQFAEEIARDEHEHVAFLRGALGRAKVARPRINIQHSFTAAARAAGLVGPHQTFNPYANEDNFLLGAFIFEDVGVTAYKGAAPLISNKTYLGAAAGILAVEAYHASNVRTVLYQRGFGEATNKISAARNSLDGDVDQGTIRHGKANIVPADKNGLAFSRTPGEVLNIVYLTPHKARRGGFFPAGVNGVLNTSA
jgi:Ferritin-like domain